MIILFIPQTPDISSILVAVDYSIMSYFPFQHENEPAENLKQKEGQEMSKSAAKNKKKREAKARAKQEQEVTGEPQV